MSVTRRVHHQHHATLSSASDYSSVTDDSFGDEGIEHQRVSGAVGKNFKFAATGTLEF